LPEQARALLGQVLECSAIGGPDTVRRRLEAFVARTATDELMLSGMIYDHAARLRSYEIAANVFISSSTRST
jgi:alkanesulfonate monooxygenase SsuD/methylene tetrahydromethanopterin reductase-like flavin-dependent oxidoreductase (luciferase family)